MSILYVLQIYSYFYIHVVPYMYMLYSYVLNVSLCKWKLQPSIYNTFFFSIFHIFVGFQRSHSSNHRQKSPKGCSMLSMAQLKASDNVQHLEEVLHMQGLPLYFFKKIMLSARIIIVVS